MMVFELLGHDNQLGRYPAPVVPIGTLDGKLVAVYVAMDGRTPDLRVVSPNARFVYMTDEQKQILKNYNYLEDFLFALSQDEVVSYKATEEETFNLSLLKDESFAQDQPFLRLTLAQATTQSEVIIKEIKNCHASIRHVPQFAHTWLQKEIQQLRKQGINPEELTKILSQ